MSTTPTTGSPQRRTITIDIISLLELLALLILLIAALIQLAYPGAPRREIKGVANGKVYACEGGEVCLI